MLLFFCFEHLEGAALSSAVGSKTCGLETPQLGPYLGVCEVFEVLALKEGFPYVTDISLDPGFILRMTNASHVGGEAPGIACTPGNRHLVVGLHRRPW